MSFFFQVNGYSAYLPHYGGGEALPAPLSCRNDLLFAPLPTPRLVTSALSPVAMATTSQKALLRECVIRVYLYGIILAENFSRVCLVTFWQNIQMRLVGMVRRIDALINEYVEIRFFFLKGRDFIQKI
ncbi:hypothetical protein CEXT_590971 [Caerostris extrusa]|uniref:Uncharacterized protein n=1 Tax=Caerostris extrusa TaxID=172846 RepID=A0AAV4S8I5_CAEEX|nr:hypothetical protein CEXT_590971 [Caerostris extrusa]